MNKKRHCYFKESFVQPLAFCKYSDLNVEKIEHKKVKTYKKEKQGRSHCRETNFGKNTPKKRDRKEGYRFSLLSTTFVFRKHYSGKVSMGLVHGQTSTLWKEGYTAPLEIINLFAQEENLPNEIKEKMDRIELAGI